MKNDSASPSRRELLGLTSVAGFVGIAGCIDALSGSDDPEFDVAIQETNSPIEDGSIFEVVVQVENVGDEERRETVTLDVGGLQPTTDVSLEPGQVTETTLSARLNTDGERREYEATVETTMAADSTDVIVQRPAELQVDVLSAPDEVIDGQTMSFELEVSNTGEASASELLILDVEELHRNPDSREVTLDAGESATIVLEWETDGNSEVEEVLFKFGDVEQSHDVTILEPSGATLEVPETNSPVVEDSPLEVDVLVGNPGEVPLNDTLTLELAGTEVAAEELTVSGGDERLITLTGDPATDAGEYDLEVVFGDQIETIPIEIRLPTYITQSAVRETPETAGEIIDIVLENESDEVFTVDIKSVIELAGQPIQFEPPRAISEPVLLTYEIPPGTHENQRTVTVSPNEELSVPLKVPVVPWPFDSSYLPDGDELALDYDYDVSLTESDADETALEPHEQVVVSEIEIAQIALSDTLVATVENVSEEPATVDIVGVLEDAAGDMDDNISDRVTVSLDPGESQQLEFEDIGARLDIPGLPFVEVDGMRDDTGRNTGLLVDVEELD